MKHPPNTPWQIPKVYREFRDHWSDPARRQQYLEAYQTGQQSFVPNLLPQQAVELSGEETIQILRRRLTPPHVETLLDPTHTDPDTPHPLPEPLRSPATRHTDGAWLKRTNMVGLNVRTIGSFWNVVKYAITLPAAQDSIHILPIFEPGVVGSLYGMSSWQLNPEFFSPELAALFPHLDTVDKQLRAVVNLLHGLGKTVGMDVIPHTDRFSEIVLMNPHYFEWLRREDLRIVDHHANLHEAVQTRIQQFINQHGPAVAEAVPDELFTAQVSQAQRQRVMFGLPDDQAGRNGRRVQMVRYLYSYGYEPVPATMAPPYRGLKVDPDETAKKVDENGLIWRDYLITEPQSMSRVFGPLTRYKLYERLDDNLNWEIDFARPRRAVWQYVGQQYQQVQQRYGFDFMRGDMSHVQMRPTGVPAHPDEYYDILGAVKHYVQQQGAPYFGYFAETFLAPPNVIAYGDEVDHLEASDAETTLGDLQSTVVGSPEFLEKFRHYCDLLETRTVTPNFTVMTADKDDPRFDQFYVAGNELRLFMAFFLADMPSYNSLGFAVRDVHLSPAPNEHYTKLYVFQETSGPKATHGPYVWGQNGALYHHVTRLKLYLDAMGETLHGRATRWLLPPYTTWESKLLAWTQADESPDYLFVVNTDLENAARDFTIPHCPALQQRDLNFDFSALGQPPRADETLSSNGKSYKLHHLPPAEGRVYRVGG